MELNFLRGQWQKIALARCLYKDGSLCFLDEPTSALDARSEQQMYQEFLAADTGQTILFVTHRMSAVHLADRVLFFEKWYYCWFLHPHAQLLRTDQTYRELYQLQKVPINKECSTIRFSAVLPNTFLTIDSGLLIIYLLRDTYRHLVKLQLM